MRDNYTGRVVYLKISKKFVNIEKEKTFKKDRLSEATIFGNFGDGYILSCLEDDVKSQAEIWDVTITIDTVG